MKDAVKRAEKLDQVASAGGTQPGSEGQRNPVQRASLFDGRGGGISAHNWTRAPGGQGVKDAQHRASVHGGLGLVCGPRAICVSSVNQSNPAGPTSYYSLYVSRDRHHSDECAVICVIREKSMPCARPVLRSKPLTRFCTSLTK